MFVVDNFPILVDEVDVIRTLRDQLAARGIIRFAKINRTANNIMVSCPFHKDGQERHPSCGILTVKRGDKPAGTYNCLACGARGTLEEFVSGCFGYSDKGAYGRKWLLKNFITYETTTREVLLDFSRESDAPKPAEYVTEAELDSYRYTHPYMYRRKLTDAIIEKFDIGYDKKRDCITMPVRDESGRTLFVATRSVKGKSFLYPPDSIKPVYGLYELKGVNYDELYVCESQINALTCWVYGKYGVALLGTGTTFQYEQLRNLPCRKLILALDPDKAGWKGYYKLKKALTNKIIYKAAIPYGKDVNDLSKEEFLNLKLELFR